MYIHSQIAHLHNSVAAKMILSYISFPSAPHLPWSALSYCDTINRPSTCNLVCTVNLMQVKLPSLAGCSNGPFMGAAIWIIFKSFFHTCTNLKSYKLNRPGSTRVAKKGGEFESPTSSVLENPANGNS